MKKIIEILFILHIMFIGSDRINLIPNNIYDLFTYLTDSQVEKISVNAIRPNTKHYNRNDNFIRKLYQ